MFHYSAIHKNDPNRQTYASSVKTSPAAVYRAWKNVCIHFLKINAMHLLTLTLNAGFFWWVLFSRITDVSGSNAASSTLCSTAVHNFKGNTHDTQLRKIKTTKQKNPTSGWTLDLNESLEKSPTFTTVRISCHFRRRCFLQKLCLQQDPNTLKLNYCWSIPTLWKRLK